MTDRIPEEIMQEAKAKAYIAQRIAASIPTTTRPTMPNKTDRLQNVAQAILALTYSEMMEIARCLQEMNEDLPRNFSSPDEWAEILHTWAETYDEARHD